MPSFRTTSLCILLGVIIMGHLIAGQEDELDEACLSCPKSSGSNESFTIRNGLPQASSDLHMVCYIWNECGGFSTYSADIGCNSIEVPTDQGNPAIEQVLCEFVWTRTNDEWFVRAQALVWSRDKSAPKKTYYLVDKDGFWFAGSPDGTLTNIGSWKGGNRMSAEKIIMGSVDGKVQGYGRNHCRVYLSH